MRTYRLAPGGSPRLRCEPSAPDCHSGTPSVLAVSHGFDGLLRARGAGLLHPAADHGVRLVAGLSLSWLLAGFAWLASEDTHRAGPGALAAAAPSEDRGPPRASGLQRAEARCGTGRRTGAVSIAGDPGVRVPPCAGGAGGGWRLLRGRDRGPLPRWQSADQAALHCPAGRPAGLLAQPPPTPVAGCLRVGPCTAVRRRPCGADDDRAEAPRHPVRPSRLAEPKPCCAKSVRLAAPWSACALPRSPAPFPQARSPFGAFPSSTAVPRHRDRCPLDVSSSVSRQALAVADRAYRCRYRFTLLPVLRALLHERVRCACAA